MLTFDKFTGINNVQPSHRIKNSELTQAVNVDIGLSGEIKRRGGYTEILATCHKNLHQADGFMLATVDGGDLTSFDANGANRVLLYPSLGPSRVWYCNLPDGRTTFSNGLICGITDGQTASAWGVPIPESVGALTPVAGGMLHGEYRYYLTYVRLADGLESGTAFSLPTTVTTGGILLTGLPVRDGYAINVYLSSHNDDRGYLAGSTTGAAFSYMGKNDALTLPSMTDDLMPAPAGTVTAFWRGRVLVAVGSVLFASRTNGWELFDLRRDFKQFSSRITLIQPVDDGLYVGTDSELAFLSGTEFDKLTYNQVMSGPVVLGSGVGVPGELVKLGDSVGQGSAMICIAAGGLIIGLASGNITRIVEGRYTTAATEVAATFRVLGGTPQYIAIPQ